MTVAEIEARVLLAQAPVSFIEATVFLTKATLFFGETAVAESKATVFLGAATLTVNAAAVLELLRDLRRVPGLRAMWRWFRPGNCGTGCGCWGRVLRGCMGERPETAPVQRPRRYGIR